MTHRRLRAALLALCAAGALAGGCAQAASTAAATAAPVGAGWTAWQHFSDAFVQADGRVVDWTSDSRTVSEGQAYGLFFALVANDRARFNTILGWTENNLADGDLKKNLPSWLWGADAQRRWRVLDRNSASDADLWIAYDLLEAGRLWKRSDYAATGKAMLAQVARTEVRRYGKRTMLLPGPQGFETNDGVRLNPSYLPPFQLTYLAGIDPKGPWAAILATYLDLLPDLAPSGAMPDWFLLTADGARKDTGSDGVGSYDAVRTYLWAAVGSDEGSLRLRRQLAPFAQFVRQFGRMPEHWYPDGRAPTGAAPSGVEAALLPLYSAVKAPDLLAAAQMRLAADTTDGLVGKPARYYEQVLTLFGQGSMDRRYAFDQGGRLKPAWRN